MGSIRKDYILDRQVYYATERKKRKNEFLEESIKDSSTSKTCFFCPGNECLTPKEIGRMEYKGSWKIRWFPNKFPAVEKKGHAKTKVKSEFLIEGDNYGVHEVIAETNDHKKQLADLGAGHIKEILNVYSLRIKSLSKLDGVKYVTVFKNKGPNAGTSLVHAHTQIAALPMLPKEVADEVNAGKKYKKCPYCSIIRLESKSKRLIAENRDIIAFAPFASRFNFEAWIFPKRHVKSIISMNDSELLGMADILKKILLKLKELNASYNFFLHYAPHGSDLHFHIEITPRIAKWGGFELSTGAAINSIMPEEAASFYRRE